MNINKLKSERGFTIVELLIVIVVIGILAAITMVSYNGIQNRSKTAAGQQLANSVSKKAQAYFTIESSYPATVGDFATGPDEAILDSPSSVKSEAAASGDNGKVVQYVACPSGGGTPKTGAQISYWDYTKGTPGPETITVGTCS